MTDLFRGVFSITTTKRRRFWWAAWWSHEPVASPFRPPDAFAGGARTRDEAKRDAERAAGRSLVEVEAKWARAWVRMREGKTPWRVEKPSAEVRVPTQPAGDKNVSAYEVLGLARDASEAEIRRAFVALALATHPDRGGDDASFIRVKRAYDSLLARRAKARPKRRHH